MKCNYYSWFSRFMRIKSAHTFIHIVRDAFVKMSIRINTAQHWMCVLGLALAYALCNLWSRNRSKWYSFSYNHMNVCISIDIVCVFRLLINSVWCALISYLNTCTLLSKHHSVRCGALRMFVFVYIRQMPLSACEQVS